MRTWLAKVLAVGAIVPMVLAMAGPANAGYPFKCPKNTVLVLEHDDPTATPSPHVGPTAIQDAIEEANGITMADADPDNPMPSDSGGDTVIVCSGTYHENVVVPLTDSGGTNSDITIRSFDDGSQPTIVGDAAEGPVFTILAPGVLLGGTHLGFEITGTSSVGIQVGTPAPPDMDQDDDPEFPSPTCPDPEALGEECAAEELAPFATSNVTVIGNEIEELGDGTSSVTGIAVNNTSNTLIFRNKVEKLSVGAGEIVYGIRYGDTNYNNDVLSNAVKELRQTGGGCDDTSLMEPTVGAVGVGVQDEALDALVHRNLIEKIESSCSAIGAYSNAWGGLENTRNGQQVPIVTDVLDNRIKKIEGAADYTAGVSLAPITPANPEDHNDPENAPSSFRVLANDIDDTEIAVAVLMGMAPNSYIRQNDLDEHQIGVLNASGFNVDATNNWWGCDEGPAGGKKSCATIENVGGSTTSYTPWLKHHAKHAGAHAGEFAGH